MRVCIFVNAWISALCCLSGLVMVSIATIDYARGDIPKELAVIGALLLVVTVSSVWLAISSKVNGCLLLVSPGMIRTGERNPQVTTRWILAFFPGEIWFERAEPDSRRK